MDRGPIKVQKFKAVFFLIKSSAYTGLQCLAGARSTYFNFHLIATELQLNRLKNNESNSALNLNRNLDQLTQDAMQSYDHVTSASHLVYATAVFDCFLTDISKFLMMLNPNPIKQHVVVGLTDLLIDVPKHKIINEIFNKKAQSKSFESFGERIKFLRKTYKIGVSINESELLKLKDIAEIRNSVAHGQSYCNFYYDALLEITHDRLSIPEHHNVISEELIRGAFELYGSLVEKISNEIESKHFKDNNT